MTKLKLTAPETFYMIRHAQTTENVRHLMSGGGSNPHLCLNSIKQAQIAFSVYKALGLTEQKIDIVTSTLQRTEETAHYLTGDKPPFPKDKRLNERYLGKAEKMRADRYFALESHDNMDEESKDDHTKRVIEAVNNHTNENRDNTTVFVVHNGTTRRVLEVIVNNPKQEFNVPNAGIFEFIPPTPYKDKWTVNLCTLGPSNKIERNEVTATDKLVQHVNVKKATTPTRCITMPC